MAIALLDGRIYFAQDAGLDCIRCGRALVEEQNTGHRIMEILIFLSGFVFGNVFLSWLVIEKLKTHDCVLVDGHVKWTERSVKNAIENKEGALFPQQRDSEIDA